MRPYVAVVMVSHKDIITGLFISFMEPVTHFISLRGLFFIRFSLYFIRLWIELIPDFLASRGLIYNHGHTLFSWTDTPYFSCEMAHYFYFSAVFCKYQQHFYFGGKTGD